MSNGTRVLITGARGFIGSHAFSALKEQGYEVEGFDLVDGQDILDMEALKRAVNSFYPNWIVHLAAQVYLKPSIDNPQKDALTNIIGTLNILEVAKEVKSGVILSSSGAVYGNNYQYPQPISPYGLSKLTAERYCSLYHEFYRIPTVVFRFSSIYGKGRAKTSVNLIALRALQGETITVTGNGEQTRDFTHVSDVVRAISMAVNNKFPSGTYDIGTGISTSILGLVKIIENILGIEAHIKYEYETLGDPKRNELNVSKAAQYGFKANTSLREGIEQLIEELKSE